ncbi:MAG: acyltransferase, partial [Flavobacterium sp.]
LNRILKLPKRKIVGWLYREIKKHEESVSKRENVVEKEKRYHDNAIIGYNSRFSKDARIFNNLNDKSRIKIGENCLIYGDILIYGHGGNVEIGDLVFIGENSRVWSSLSIKVGNNVLISHNVNIHDNNSHPLDSNLRRVQAEIILTKGLPDSSFGTKEDKIVIEDDVWIGFNSSINKGVTVGKGSIVAAGSYVFKDVPPYSVVMGNPAQIVSKTQ